MNVSLPSTQRPPLLGPLLLLAALVASGCNQRPPTAVARMELAAVLPAVQALPAHAVPAPSAPAPALPAATPSPAQPTALDLQLMGQVSLPKGVGGLANAHDGIVAGAPVQVLDVSTGRHIGNGVTYYDGSFAASVPASLGKRPALVQVMLVDATTRADLFPLVTALELSPELAIQRADIDPGTTAWVALLCQLAGQHAKAAPPDWTHLAPGTATATMGAMIAGTGPEAVANFGLFTAANKALATPDSPQALRKAIDAIVANLLSTAKTS